MKVLLINPPSLNEMVGNNPEIIESERGHNPPIGLLYLAAYLDAHSNHTVEVLDTQVEEFSYKQLETELKSRSFDVAGITAMTLTMIDVIKTIELIEKVNPNGRIVIGGPHPHIFPEETIQLKNVDYLVLGEGEIPFNELLDHMDDFKALKSVKGLVFIENGQIIKTGFREYLKDLDQLPIPARHLTPYQKYSSLLAKRTPVTIMITSRGCPFRCTFCDRPQLGKLFRPHSAQYVVNEMQACTEMGIHEFLIYDDTFTVQRQRVIEICDEILNRNLDVGWDIRSRVDTIDREMLKKLKRAGCRGIHYGVEAGTPMVLKTLNKGINLEKVEEIFKMTRQEGLLTLGYFMIGNPTETRDDILQTFKLTRKLNADYIHLTILTPFPGTQLYLNGLKNNIFKKDIWREYAQNPDPLFVPPHWDEHFTLPELKELLVKGYKSFYTRPDYILRKIKQVNSLAELKRKAMAGLKVFNMKY